MTQKIPDTGRIGRFAKIVKANSSEESYLKVMQESDQYGSYNAQKKALWWKQAIEKLELEVGPEDAVDVMRTCGSKCCGNGQRKTAKKMMAESKSLQEFLEKFVNYGVKDGELGYEIIDDNTFITRHNKCFCGQVKKSREVFKNATYCQCSVEFNKQFFQAAFGKPVEVKLKQSILNGDDFCEFEINHAYSRQESAD